MYVNIYHEPRIMPRRRPNTKAGQREATMQDLVRIARRHFAESGYTQASTEAIVREAGVTRGAMYHHFGNKEGLFLAVVSTIQKDVARQVSEASEAVQDPWEQLVAGCHAFMHACLKSDVQRILLIDGPAALGWEAWRRLDAENAVQLLEEGLRQLVDHHAIAIDSIPAATQLLSGAMNEAVLWIARSPDPEQALKEAKSVLDRLLAGLRDGTSHDRS